MHTVAVEGTAMVMLLEEHHLVCGDILQMVDSLLAMGEVPGLFSAEERDKLILAMTERGAKGVVDDRSPQALASALVQAVKQVRTFSVFLGFTAAQMRPMSDC
jgi:hypothetical protein